MCGNPPKLKILELWFTNNLSDAAELNMTDTFIEVKKLFNIWAKRTITPLGRVAVLKPSILSKLVYLLVMLPNPPDKFINDAQKLCFEFLWERKRDKIKRSIVIHNTSNGGINIPDIETHIKALKSRAMHAIFV